MSLLWRRSDVFIVTTEQISHNVLVFLVVDLKQINKNWDTMCISL